MTSFLRAWFRFAEEHTVAYYSSCLLVGLGLRLWMAHGDWLKVIDPRFPFYS